MTYAKDFRDAFEQIAAGLAHEVRNPLSLVKASIELMELTETGEEIRRRYGIMRRELDRANRALTELMQLAAPSAPPSALPLREAVSLNSVLYGLVDTMRLTYGNDIDFALDSAAAHYIVYADADKLMGVFRNLLKNAAEAIREADIKSPGLKGLVRLALYEENGFAVVTVTDNGIGLAEGGGALACEPHYTTKADGHGLGLFVSRTAVAEHGGTLTLSPAAGGGCIAEVRLPLER